MKFSFEVFKKNNEPSTEDKSSKIERNSKPIRVCLIDSDYNDKKSFLEIEKNGQFIDYKGTEDFYKKNNIKNQGEKTYVISETNERDKYSKEYLNCTGVILVGTSLDNKEISFMTHQYPPAFLHSNNLKFSEDLKKTIEEFKNKTKNETIDSIIFSGQEGYEEGYKGNYGQYKESIDFLGKLITTELGFEPTVVTGPREMTSSYDSDTNVYFDTQNRRLYVERPSQRNQKLNEDYFPSELEKKEKEW